MPIIYRKPGGSRMPTGPYSRRRQNKAGQHRSSITKTSTGQRMSKRFTRAVTSVLNRREEKKYHPVITNAFLPVGTGSTYSLSEIPQGDSDSSRDGDQVYLTSIQFNWTLFIGTGPSSADNVMSRLILYQYFDTITGGSAPATGSLLISVASEANIINSPYNHDQRYKFRVLYDKVVSLNPLANRGASDSVMITKFPRHKIQYESGGVTGINKLFLFVITNSSTNQPVINFYTKVNYKDN